MRLLFAVILLLGVSPAQAFHKPTHVPPGIALPVCDCLAVEIRHSAFDNRDRLVVDQALRDVVGALTLSGSMECTEPEPGSATPGEAMLRMVLTLLDGTPAWDQEVCRP